jgi:hypothetical protein
MAPTALSGLMSRTSQPDPEPRSALRDLERRRQKVQAFVDWVSAHLHLQFHLRQITTMQELVAFSKRHRVPIDHLDVTLFYRDFNEPFWPWYGRPKQVRRHFAHLGRMP